MNTKIISISDDQNTITHESGVVTEFVVQGGKDICKNCVYNILKGKCSHIICVPIQRKDERNGIFKLKTT